MPQVPLTVSSGTVQIPFASLSGGAPVDALDPTTIIGMQWQLSGPLSDADSGGAGTAKFSVKIWRFTEPEIRAVEARRSRPPQRGLSRIEY